MSDEQDAASCAEGLAAMSDGLTEGAEAYELLRAAATFSLLGELWDAGIAEEDRLRRGQP